jgi:hypothetical protein
LNGRLTTPIGGGPATARLTRREDRSAQLGRGPENLGNRAAAKLSVPKRLSRIRRLSRPLEPSYEVQVLERLDRWSRSVVNLTIALTHPRAVPGQSGMFT